MAAIEQIIIENIDVWSGAVKQRKAQGRGSSQKLEQYGIKKLRLLVLELAFSGRLVEKSNEGSGELMQQLKEAKADLIKKKALRKSKSAGNITGDEVRLSIPVNWSWVRLGDAFDVRDGTHDSPKYQEDGFPLVTSKNIYARKLDLSNVKYISEEDHLKISERSKVDRGDILFAMIGSIGNPVIIDIEPHFSVKNVGLFKYYSLELSCPEYLRYYLQLAETWLKEEASGAVQSFVSLGKLRNYPFPLASLSEQKRIVAKVDELMALCDQLEQQQENSIAAHQQLVEVLLAALTTMDGGNEGIAGAHSFAAAWARIAENFDTLFTTEHSIDQLKQTILQLAVMGKLVPQDPNDEPASVLLEEIAAEKEKLIQEGKIKKQKALPKIIKDQSPYKLPIGWEWGYLSDFASFENGDRSRKYPNKGDLVQKGVPFFGAPDIKDGKLAFTDDLRFITQEKFNDLSNGKLKDRDFIVLLRGSVGKVAQFKENDEYKTGFINAQMLIVRLIIKDFDEFVYKYFISDTFKRNIEDEKSGAVIQQLPASKIAKLLIPIPPLNEQKRIVKKVDELFAICDQIKAKINTAQATQLNLADTITNQAVQ